MSNLAGQPSVSRDRRSGVLLHPTCLPNRWGIGDLGAGVYEFVDLLNAMHQRLWQVLPLGPPALSGSPYSTLSAIAGNPLLISLDMLAREGLLDVKDASSTDAFGPVNFEQVTRVKLPCLRSAYARLPSSGSRRDSFVAFCVEQAEWLDDYALFMALKDAHAGKSWNHWAKSLVTRRKGALRQAQRELDEDIAFHQFTQYVFFAQWSALRAYVHERGIRIVGDIPFYVALDSADVWSHPRNFALDRKTGEALRVAGVPPDYFSQTGQLWNTPVYDWRHLEQTGFTWWVERFRKLLQMVDIVRIDHFRGFAAYWQVPQGAQTAVEGEWVEAPGEALFTTLRDTLGNLPIWAEDLGLITAEVEQLRDKFDLPGMKVLQFAFDEKGVANPYLPFNYGQNCVCYTATHDNDTTRGWWAQLDPSWKRCVAEYLGGASDSDIHWSLIRLALSSVANDVIIPWQDVLGLGTEGRLNVPGTARGNWVWRFSPQMVTSAVQQRLSQLTTTFGRAPRTQQLRASTPPR